MKSHQKPDNRASARLFSLMLVLVLVLSLVPAAVFAADSYTSVAKGSVSWTMINQNPDTFYWKDSKGGYCALKAVRSGNNYYVTMYTTEKGSELRYLKQKKNDDSGSSQKWSGASGVYTGGVLYKKAGGSSSDSGSGSSSGGSSGGSGSSSGTSTSGSVAADGTYTANGTVSFSKDNYSFTLTLTISGGKIASMSQTITTSTQESKSKSEYQPKAMSALSSALVGKAATTDSVDAVSSGTPKYSFAALKAAAREAIASATGSSSGGSGSGSEGGYTPVTESEVGKGVGSKTGTKYTGTGTISDEYVTLDVYVSGGKIVGLFINAEVGDWLNLLTEESSNYIGKSADVATVNAVSSATTLGFRNTIRDAIANALSSAGTYTPVTESEIGKGAGSKTGTAYTGTGTIGDEYVTLDVYVNNGKITGLFIKAEEGDWLNLLTDESTKYIGKSADAATVNAVSSATSLGFRNTIRDAVAAAMAKVPAASESSSGNYVVDGYEKEYSYSALCTGKYYYKYGNSYYKVNGLKYYSRDKGKYYYCGYFVKDGVNYYLDDKPQAYNAYMLDEEHPGDDDPREAYESCKKSKVSSGKKLPLYIVR